MRSRLFCIVFVLECCCFGNISGSLSASNNNSNKKRIEQLKTQKKKADRKARQLNTKIDRNKHTLRSSLYQIEAINQNIAEDNRLVAQKNEEIHRMNSRIDSLSHEILRMEMNYNVAKRKYVELLYKFYQKNTVYDRLLYLFSANSVQQAYLRFRYVRLLAQMRRTQAIHIQNSRADLVAKKNELIDAKRDGEKLLADREREMRNLERDKVRQKEMIAHLRKRGRELRSQLARQQQASNRLNNRIQSLVEAEVRRSQKLQRSSSRKSTAKSSSPSQRNFSSSSRDDNTSAGSNFASVKGRMHWPVWNGFISGHFGNHPHPVLKNVMVDNKGVYITAPARAMAISTFAGKVTQIFSIPGSNNAIIVRHGDYLTVYANLTSVCVKQGQQISRGSNLGRIFTDPDDSEHSVLFFQVWREKNLQNPEKWLRPLK